MPSSAAILYYLFTGFFVKGPSVAGTLPNNVTLISPVTQPIGPVAHGTLQARAVAVKDGMTMIETFHGIHEHSEAPQEQSFRYKTQGIDWINFAKVDSDDQMGKNIMEFPEGHRRTQVAAIGGMVDCEGRAIKNPMAMMLLQPGSDVEKFDVNSFDFYCLDATHTPVYCKMGLATSQELGFLPPPERLQTFEFDPTPGPRARMQKAYVPEDMSCGLSVASFGLPLARIEEVDAKETNATKLASFFLHDNLNPEQHTLYVDNIEWTPHKFASKDCRVELSGEFNKSINAILSPDGFGLPEAAEEEEQGCGED